MYSGSYEANEGHFPPSGSMALHQVAQPSGAHYSNMESCQPHLDVACPLCCSISLTRPSIPFSQSWAEGIDGQPMRVYLGQAGSMLGLAVFCICAGFEMEPGH